MRLPYILTSLLLLLTLTGCSITHTIRVADHAVIDVETMIRELDGSQVVFVGERHDESAHHELQLQILKAFLAQGRPLAIGMEMFESESQPALDAWSAGRVPEDAFRQVYKWSWRNVPWSMYSDIFRFARDNRIPIVALNAPRATVQAVARFGFDSLGDDQLKKLPAGLDATARDIDLEVMRAYATHGKSGDALRNIAEAQLLRNMVMGRRIGDYLEKHPDRVMVVLAGGGHARRSGGVPSVMRKEIRHKVVLPPVAPITISTVSTRDADYLVVEPF